MMKSNLLLILNLCFPLLLWSQFSVEFLNDTNFQRAELGDDPSFHYMIYNPSETDTIEVSWRLWYDLEANSGTWEDYFAELLGVLWPPSVRSQSFTILPQDSIEVTHTLLSFDSCGYFTAELSFFQGNDSNSNDFKYAHSIQSGEFIMSGTDSLFVCREDTFLVKNGDYIPNGIRQNSASYQLKIFPNPSNGDVAIRSTELIRRVSIYSIDGKLIYSQNVQQAQLDVSLEVPNGIYIIDVQLEDHSVRERILIH